MLSGSRGGFVSSGPKAAGILSSGVGRGESIAPSVNDVGVLAGVGLRFGDVVFPVWEDKGAGLW